MYAEERQGAIARLITERGRVSVNDLAEEFTVTTETVRRDLTALSRTGIVRRVHGGAVPVRSVLASETGVAERDSRRGAEKDRIARAVLEFLPPRGGSVVFDAGTTTGRIAALLPHDTHLTAVTNSLPTGLRLSSLPGINLHMLGGQVRTITQAVIGAEAVTTLSTLRCDVAFIGTNGVSLDHGLSTPDAQEAEVKRAMVSSARLVVVAADSTKIDAESLHRFASLDAVDVLVTDTDINAGAADQLRALGVEVVTA